MPSGNLTPFKSEGNKLELPVRTGGGAGLDNKGLTKEGSFLRKWPAGDPEVFPSVATGAVGLDVGCTLDGLLVVAGVVCWGEDEDMSGLAGPDPVRFTFDIVSSTSITMIRLTQTASEWMDFSVADTSNRQASHV